MSKEILKALMQLFAIICKQDLGLTDTERNFVQKILHDNLTLEQADEYIKLFDSYFDEYEVVRKTGDENTKEKLTNVKDSVRTLAICKKINKTLEQKQKVIVLLRLLELVKQEHEAATHKMEIVDTVASVFNIPSEEYKLLQEFAFARNEFRDIRNANFMIIGEPAVHPEAPVKHIHYHGLEGLIGIVHVKSTDMYFLHYEGRGTLQLNGITVDSSWITIIPHGSLIRSSFGAPIFYSDIVQHFLSDIKMPKLSFNVNNLEYRFDDKIGITDIQISEGAGKLVGIMGGSGAGKTTLMNVLSGIKAPSAGNVLINGIDMHKKSEAIEGLIGFVAQDDILFEDLTVYQNLFFNAKLCFGSLTDEEINKKVESTLKDLGLYYAKDIKVGNVIMKKISGGQRKRLNIALELIREPAILFLDEPTSGLSSKDSENVMDLLKELTLKGKLIFVVIHQPSSDIYKMFDKMVILDFGGRQIFYGNPIEAVVHFKHMTGQLNDDLGQCGNCGNVNPEAIFDAIETRVVDEYGRPTEIRKYSPNDWVKMYKDNTPFERLADETEKPERALALPSLLKQLVVFIKRDVLSKVSNLQYMLINLLEAPLLAAILAFVIKHTDHPEDPYFFGLNDNIPAYLLMSVIVSLFMGLTVSAEEIIKDIRIIRRERFLHLSRFSYINSKVLILFTLSAVQTLTYVVLGNLILGIEGMNMHYWVILFSTSCMANMIGLNISSAFNSAVTIYILIPILLIPQMILSGAIFSFDKLNYKISSLERVPLIADFMVSRWAYEALSVTQFKDNKFEKSFFEVEQKESVANYKNAYWAPYLLEESDDCITMASKGDIKNPDFQKGLTLIHNEFDEEKKDEPSFKYDASLFTAAAKGDAKALQSIHAVIVKLKDDYSEKFIEINTSKDAAISGLMADPKKKAFFYDRQQRFYNDRLADVVKGAKEKKKLVELDGHLIPKIDPVFFVPEKPANPLNYRAHLYSPIKYFMGIKFDTLWFNVMMIWIMTIMGYISLYYGLLGKFIDWLSNIGSKKV